VAEVAALVLPKPKEMKMTALRLSEEAGNQKTETIKTTVTPKVKALKNKIEAEVEEVEVDSSPTLERTESKND